MTGTAWQMVSGNQCAPEAGFTDYTPAGQNVIYATGDVSPAFSRFDITTGVWTALSGFPLASSPAAGYAGPAWVGSSLFLIESGSVFRYDLPTGGWTTVMSGVAATSQAQNAHDDSGNVYVFTTDDRVARFNTTTHVLTYFTFGVGPTPREPRVAWDSLSGLLYVVPFFLDARLYSFDPSTGIVIPLASYPDTAHPTIGDAFCSDRSGHLYAAGSVGSSIYQYDIASNSWRAIPSLPFVSMSMGACTVVDSGYIYVSDGGPSPSVARLQLF